jgi:hypothetical protein
LLLLLLLLTKLFFRFRSIRRRIFFYFSFSVNCVVFQILIFSIYSDGDRITVTTELEFEECKRECSESAAIRLFITAPANAQYFKDGSIQTRKLFC